VERGAGRGAVAWEHDARSACSGGSNASEQRGRGASHGRARAELFRGIDPGCRGESGGEMTGQGVDGGELALLGCPRWSWRRPGRRGVLAQCHCDVGLMLGLLQGGDQLLGVEGGGLVED
jgi:hypothetical protein